jgi:hypothetical protein
MKHSCQSSEVADLKPASEAGVLDSGFHCAVPRNDGR